MKYSPIPLAKKFLSLYPVIMILLAIVTPAASVHAQTPDDILNQLNTNSRNFRIDDNTLRGQLRPINFTIISAGIDAKIDSFPVKTGNRVNAGDLIAEFNCNVERANFNIEQSRENVAIQNFEINERLFNLRNISEMDLSISESETMIARSEVERTSSILSECVLRAPFSGTVTEKYLEAYQYANRGDQLIQLVDTENLEIEMVLPSLNLGRYQQGAEFTIQIDETGQVVNAQVDRIVNVIDPVSQTIRVIGVLINPPEGLMPGMSGAIRFPF